MPCCTCSHLWMHSQSSAHWSVQDGILPRALLHEGSRSQRKGSLAAAA